ncbi:MAG: metal ABC transporter permease [Actinomycetota bacterium]|nr:metal ABC transporter permease [Actinomycetota bacterium]
MSTPQLEIQAVAAVVAVACALPGVFLVLRRMALVSDAISHSMLLGIVLAFFLVPDLSSPALIVGAALSGLVATVLIELLRRTELVKEDAAIGLVFPILFSGGVILIARYADNVHLDTDVVLLGEPAFTPFDRVVIAGYDIGPKALLVMSAILLVNVVFIGLFYKELKLATFDPGLAAVLGFSPALLHYSLMSVVSVTAVGAFDAAGAILVVALMIAPAATAYLLTDRLSVMLALSAVVAVAGAVAGYWLAHWLDASIAGSMACVLGVLFALAVVLAPGRGVLALARRRARHRWEFAQAMLVIHLQTHEHLPESVDENRVEHLGDHLRWDPDFAARVVRGSERRGLVVRRDGLLELTVRGRRVAEQTVAG